MELALSNENDQFFFREHQIRVLKVLLKGVAESSSRFSSQRHLIIINHPCGSGKSFFPLTLAVDAMKRNVLGPVVVLVPTNVLGADMESKFAKHVALSPLFVTGNTSMTDLQASRLILITPDRIVSRQFLDFASRLAKSSISFRAFFVDEADLIAEEDWRYVWKKAFDILCRFTCPVILMSGTFTEEVVEYVKVVFPDLISYRKVHIDSLPVISMSSPLLIRDQVVHSETKKELFQQVLGRLDRVVKEYVGDDVVRILIPCATRALAVQLTEELRSMRDHLNEEERSSFQFVQVFDLTTTAESNRFIYERLQSNAFRSRICDFRRIQKGVAVLIGTSTLCRGVDFERVIAVYMVGGFWSLSAYAQARCRIGRGHGSPSGESVVFACMPTVEMILSDEGIKYAKDTRPQVMKEVSFKEFLVRVSKMDCIYRILSECFTAGEGIIDNCRGCSSCVARELRESFDLFDSDGIDDGISIESHGIQEEPNSASCNEGQIASIETRESISLDYAIQHLPQFDSSQIIKYFSQILDQSLCPLCEEDCFRRKCSKMKFRWCYACFSRQKGSTTELRQHHAACKKLCEVDFEVYSGFNICIFCYQTHQEREHVELRATLGPVSQQILYLCPALSGSTDMPGNIRYFTKLARLRTAVMLSINCQDNWSCFHAYCETRFGRFLAKPELSLGIPGMLLWSFKRQTLLALDDASVRIPPFYLMIHYFRESFK